MLAAEIERVQLVAVTADELGERVLAERIARVKTEILDGGDCGALHPLVEHLINYRRN